MLPLLSNTIVSKMSGTTGLSENEWSSPSHTVLTQRPLGSVVMATRLYSMSLSSLPHCSRVISSPFLA